MAHRVISSVPQVAGAIAAALLLIACSATPSSPGKPAAPAAESGSGKLQEYYEKARSSGELKVTLYSAGPEYRPIFDLFQERYPGTQVEGVLIRGPEMIQRFQAEASSGRRIANVAATGATTMSTLEGQGLFAEWEGPPNAAELPEIPLTSGKARWAYAQNAHGFVVNTDQVPDNRVPKTRQDVLDPFFKGKGKLLVDDPRGGGPSIEFFTYTYDQLGQAWMDALKGQEITWTRERDGAPTQIARGEYAMFFPAAITVPELELQKSAPLKAGWFRDGGAMVVALNIGVVKDAPGQDVARLFVGWLTGPEGQKAIAEKLQTYPALPSAPAPAGYPSLQEINPSRRTADQIRRNNEYIELFDGMFFK
jgi:iron(III) transport system substrate-binding protein